MNTQEESEKKRMEKGRMEKRRIKRQGWSGREENERQMANNVNCEEMRFLIRNLVDVDDVSPATAPEILFDVCLNYVGIFPKRKG